MAQTATMGPPLSPRETRRSGRRSAPSVSASASKSPDSDQPPRDRAAVPRVASSSSTSRSKKLKQEEYDDPVDERKQQALPSNASSGSNSTSSNNNNGSKPKRKPKDKQSGSTEAEEPEEAPPEGQGPDPADEEEEQGITRCVCGSAGTSFPVFIECARPDIRTRQRTILMLANLWCSVRPAKSGSMAYVWATHLRTRCTMTITIASYANRRCTPNFSSTPPVPYEEDPYPEFSTESWHGNPGRPHRAPDKIPLLLRESRDLIPLLIF